jgi:hypothetical protein
MLGATHGYPGHRLKPLSRLENAKSPNANFSCLKKQSCVGQFEFGLFSYCNELFDAIQLF